MSLIGPIPMPGQRWAIDDPPAIATVEHVAGPAGERVTCALEADGRPLEGKLPARVSMPAFALRRVGRYMEGPTSSVGVGTSLLEVLATVARAQTESAQAGGGGEARIADLEAALSHSPAMIAALARRGVDLGLLATYGTATQPTFVVSPAGQAALWQTEATR